MKSHQKLSILCTTNTLCFHVLHKCFQDAVGECTAFNQAVFGHNVKVTARGITITSPKSLTQTGGA